MQTSISNKTSSEGNLSKNAVIDFLLWKCGNRDSSSYCCRLFRVVCSRPLYMFC